MPPGHNGPWVHAETPVRNTGHWLITFLFAADQTSDERYEAAARNCIEYLISTEARPQYKTYHHLDQEGASRPNGLVGQAWTMEALVLAAQYFNRPELFDIAVDTFSLHPFDEALAAWKVVDIDGTVVEFDLTFNHQLWFAAAGAMVAQGTQAHSQKRLSDEGASRTSGVSKEIDRQIQRFLDELPKNISVDVNGLIKHPFKPNFNARKYMSVGIDTIRSGRLFDVVQGAFESSIGDSMIEKAVGYHSFNLYGLALLYCAYPNHPTWDDDRIQHAINYGKTDAFRRQLDGNPYGYPYNVSGIEMAFVEEVFGNGNHERMSVWLNNQLDRTYDPNEHCLSQNTSDPTTLTARLYEATRVPNVSTNIHLNAERREGET